MPDGAAARRLVNHVDYIAILDEIFGPAFAPVRRLHPVGRCLRSAMNENQRVGLCHLPGSEHLDIHLALHDLFAGLANIFAACVEESAFGNRSGDC